MKLIIQLLVAALILNACVRAGESAWRYYQFKDAVEQEARYGTLRTTSLLRQRIMQIAADNSVDLDPDDVIVESRDRGIETQVEVRYIDPIPLVPRAYTRLHEYEISLRLVPVRPIVSDDK
jgi:hypothetical protein